MKYCAEYVCLSDCLIFCTFAYCKNVTKFSETCVLNVVVALYFSGSIRIRYLLPVL